MKTLMTAGFARLASCCTPFGKILRSVSLLAASLSLGASANAVPLLPGVLGYGAEKNASSPYTGNTAGFGAGSDVIEVLNTNDSGTGSLRAALAVSSSSPRVIVFKTSGVITLATDLKLDFDNRTIAGQTAPYPGITIRGASFVVRSSNVLVQHLRFRPGDEWNDAVPTHNRDSIRVEHGSDTLKNIVFDHCTFSWSTDEAVSTWAKWDNVTFNRCLFAEPLEQSIHIDEGVFDNTLPMQAEKVSSIHLVDGSETADGAISYSGTTGSSQYHAAAVGGTPTNYHLITGSQSEDYVEYSFPVEMKTGTRLGNYPLITCLTGPNQAKFKVKVYDPAGGLIYTSEIFNPNQSVARVNFTGTTAPFSIVGYSGSLKWRNYKVRVVFDDDTGTTNWKIGVDQVTFIQSHGMGPLLAWGSDTGGKLSFTKSVMAHIRERGPWAYPKQLLFANNVLYNRSSRFLMLGHLAEGTHGLATTKAEIVGNKVIEGQSFPTSYVFKNQGLSTDATTGAKFRFTDNDWDDGSYSGSLPLFGPTGTANSTTVATTLTSDPRYSSGIPISLTEGLAGFTPLSSASAFNTVVLSAGARPAERDSAEQRVLTGVAQSVTTQTLGSRPGDRVNSVAEAGGWPSSWFQSNPVDWTVPDHATVANTDPDGNGYTVIEEWLQRLATQVEGTGPEAQVYNEAFAGTAPALQWTPVTGTWTESGGTYAQSANLTSAISVYNGGMWATDYTVSARLFNDWTGTGNRVGLVYNYVNSSNYSYVTFNTSGLVEVTRVTNGATPDVIASGLYLGGGDAVWFEATLRRRGNTTAILVNGQPCLPNVWEENLGLGKVGLFTRSNQTGKFDDFKVLANSSGVTSFNDFTGGTAPGWTVTGDGTWTFPTDGSTVWHQNSITAITPFATLDNSFNADHSILADVKHVSFGSSGWFGVFARYSDANNYYYVKINGTTAEIKKMANGTFTTIASGPYTPSTTVFRTLQFVVKGSVSTDLALYSDGALVCGATDPAGLPAGKAGLLTYRASVKYDNVSVSPTAVGTALAADDFQAGAGNWTSLTGSWAVSSGWYRQSDTTNTDSRTRQGGAVTNQSVEANVRALQNPLPANKWLGVLARFTDVNNYYYLILRQNGLVELKKIVGGSFSTLDDAPFTLVPNATNTLKLEVIGTSLRGYVNGNLLVRANDTSLPSGTNGAALMTSGLSAEFDDVLVTQP